MSHPYDPNRPGPYGPGGPSRPPHDPRRRPVPAPRPAPAPRPHPSEESRRDVEAALAARRELGPEYEDPIAAGLAERVEALVAYRMADRQVESAQETGEAAAERGARTQRFVLGLASLTAGIPITAISATQVEPGLLGVAVSWAGIVGVNVAHALSSRRRRD